MSGLSILEGLNENQRHAVTYTDGPLLIIAGPGTGKTLTITRRILYLIHTGVRPSEIVALTFTNRAGREMRERISPYLTEEKNGLFLGTFHMFGLNILRRYYNRDFRLIERKKQLEILKSITDGTLKKAQALLDYISRVKNLYDVESMKDSAFLKYEEILKDKNSLDMDDIILKAMELLKTSREAHADIARLKHVLIDEYQDINPLQYEFIKSLYGVTENICAVGDIDQAIYAFRGADIEHFLNFKRDFKGAHSIFLKENYRSTPTIVQASQSLIKHNKKRIAHPLESMSFNTSNKIKFVTVNNEYEEAKTIVREIEKKMGATSHYSLTQNDFRGEWDNNYRFSDFAVLFRTNHQADVIREAFVDSGIPYQLIKDVFYEAIEDIIDKLKMSTNEIPQGKNIAHILDDAFATADTEGLLGLKRNLLHAYEALQAEIALKKVTDELYLFRSPDAIDRSSDSVSLMTLHMSKGLEFKVVFIAGFEEGLIPYSLANTEEEIEEERRLFYVGMTRAKEELFLLCSEKRHVHGAIRMCKKSRFFYEIPDGLMDEITISKKEKPKKRPKQQSLF
ncbi:MAG TPA: ATP-dependent helicase [Syntrophorhabdaceae bacterium]|nr:ATP-dependent helicase [Syntrophorhabdaceae bacterium]HON84482.1 ATP-dependent helicase [Syntrophorhabdaceae bacterium]HOT41221.1 ATP-dependent helicase [Syntrophorhabdaceae bacterium]HPC65716.1 ATP-dependent helicase [Syntrophorhabdaceae bacterium]HQE79914.1 ATP-dependent helicase [Syntrophorhabdaceae bacterium]